MEASPRLNPNLVFDTSSQILHSLSCYVLTSAREWLTWSMITHFIAEIEGAIQKSANVQFKGHREYKGRGKENLTEC